MTQRNHFIDWIIHHPATIAMSAAGLLLWQHFFA